MTSSPHTVPTRNGYSSPGSAGKRWETTRSVLQLLGRHPVVLFILIGLAAAWIVRIDGSDRVVQVRLTFTLAGFYLAGALVEQQLGIRGSAPLAPIHRIVLGQLVLVIYFYLRSPLAHVGLPGITRAELYAVVAVAGFLLWRHARKASTTPTKIEEVVTPLTPVTLALLAAGVWFAWWISLHTFLAYRSGALHTPSSDPDGHAYLAKLLVMGGKIAYTQTPYSSDPQTYPSGFATLNAIWALFSGASVVKILNCQMTLQACLAVGLVLEGAASFRRHLGLATSLVLLAIAHWVFFFPVNSESWVLGGTARFSHSALLLWPLTLSLRLGVQSTDPGVQPIRLRLLGILAASLSLTWAFVINPSHAIVALPVLAATVLMLLTGVRFYAHSERTRRRSLLLILGAAIILPALLIFSDAMVVGSLRGVQYGAAGAIAGRLPQDPPNSVLQPVRAIRAGGRRVRQLSTLGIFPPSCFSGPKCDLLSKSSRFWWPVPVYVLALGYLGWVATALMRRRKTSDVPSSTGKISTSGDRVFVRTQPDLLRNIAFSIAALAFSAVLVTFLTAFIEDLLIGQRALRSVLLARYTAMGLRTVSPYLHFLFVSITLCAAALITELAVARWRRLPARSGTILKVDVAVSAIILAALTCYGAIYKRHRLRISKAYKSQVTISPKTTTTGSLSQIDVDFIKKVQSIVPQTERVLLPGLAVRMPNRENWIFAESTSRALPLYSDTHFAFYLGQGPKEFTAEAYMQHVCKAFDLPWLASHAVNWVLMSDGIWMNSCIHNWDQLHKDYYEEVLRMQDRRLYRLRPDRFANAKSDPRLDLPLSEARFTGPKGEAVRGDIEIRGPYIVKGWACDYGSSAHVTVELELTDTDNPRSVFREYHLAGLVREPRIAQACHGSSDHGFQFAPATVPLGTYRLRVIAYDGPGETAKLLAENILITVPM